jgi:hypothetical protein
MLWKFDKADENCPDTSADINKCRKGIFEAEIDKVSPKDNHAPGKTGKLDVDVHRRRLAGAT